MAKKIRVSNSVSKAVAPVVSATEKKVEVKPIEKVETKPIEKIEAKPIEHKVETKKKKVEVLKEEVKTETEDK